MSTFKLQKTTAASRGFPAAARLSCYNLLLYSLSLPSCSLQAPVWRSDGRTEYSYAFSVTVWGGGQIN